MSIEPDRIGQDYWQEHGMEYMRYEYPLKPHDYVLDLGAYNGQFAETIHNKYGCHVICVEPTAHIMGLIGKPGFTVINKAASTKEETKRFGGAYYHTSEFADYNTFGYKDFICYDINETINHYQRFGLLKMNVEGAEYELMDHIMPHIHKFDYLQIQYHMLDEESDFKWRVIMNKLKQTHECQWCVKFVWESWRKII